MQLADAISGWTSEHAHALSPSTRSDIESISDGAARSGWAGTRCADLPASAFSDIAALTPTGPGEAAISEFLTIVVDWGVEHDLTTGDEPELAQPGWLDESRSGSHAITPAHGIPAVGGAIQDDESTTEDRVDSSDTIESSEAIESSDGSAPMAQEAPGAASLLATIDQSAAAPGLGLDAAEQPRAAPPQTDGDNPTIVETVRPTGVFTEAAEHGAERGGSIDWPTVAYFSIAAIFFGLMIYLYFAT